MKKFISLILALVMAFSVAVPSFAAEEAEKAYDGDPVVIVRGIDFGALIHEDGSKALAFNFNDFLGFIFDFPTGVAKKEKDSFETALLSFMQKLFAPISSDKEGRCVYPDVHMQTYLYPAGEIEELEEWTDGEGGLVQTAVNTFGGENAAAEGEKTAGGSL